jgi:hypothetical protein
LDPQVPNESLIIERGIAAEQLLQSEVFQAAANTLMNTYTEEWLRTSPSDTQGREMAYAHATSVQDIVGLLNQWVAMRDQMVANQNEATDQLDY